MKKVKTRCLSKGDETKGSTSVTKVRGSGIERKDKTNEMLSVTEIIIK